MWYGDVIDGVVGIGTSHKLMNTVSKLFYIFGNGLTTVNKEMTYDVMYDTYGRYMHNYVCKYKLEGKFILAGWK